MRERLVGLVLFGLFLTLSPPAALAGHEYKIGVVVAVTGPASSLGVPERDVTLMLQKALDAKGGIKGPDGALHRVRLIIHDDESKPDTTVKVVKKLIEEDQVVGLVASSQSPTSLAVIPITTQAKVPHVSLASSHAIVTPVRERHWVFKTPQSNIHVAVHQVKYLKAKGQTRIASLYVNDAFGEDSRKALTESIRGSGIEVVYEDKFEHTDKDMTPQLVKVKGSGAQVLIVHAIPPAASIITKQFRDLGLGIPLIHNHGVGNKRFIELAAGTAEGVIFPVGKMLVAEQLPDADPQKRVLLEFVQAYEKFSGKPRSTFAGHAWDALEMIFMALGKVDPNAPLERQRAQLRDGLEQVRNWPGTGGIFNMSAEDHVGLDDRAMVIVRIVKGEWEYFPPAKW